MITTVSLRSVPGINPQQMRVYCHPTRERLTSIRRRDVDLGRYSRSCTYHKYEYHYDYQSWAQVRRNGSSVTYTGHDGERFTHRAPSGWAWGIDANGLRLYRTATPTIDYHPHGEELRRYSGDSGEHCRENALRNWRISQEARRRERKATADRLARDAARRELVDRAIWYGVDVTLADSRAAGNCEAGTLAWAQRHGIDRHDVPVAEIAEFAGDYRVYRAIEAAVIRTEREAADDTLVLSPADVADAESVLSVA